MVNPYMYFVLLCLHVLGIVVWIGGSFFSYAALPAAGTQLLQPGQQLAVWQATFKRFFPWVWVSVIAVFVSGEWLAHGWLDGLNAPLYIHVMFGIGVLLMLLFGHIYFSPYRRMRQAMAAGDEAEALRRLRQIRMLLGVIGVVGLLVVIIGVAGPMFMDQPLVLDRFDQ